jgi:tripartite-type tricarboxylate transporter receptor subunit TctC
VATLRRAVEAIETDSAVTAQFGRLGVESASAEDTPGALAQRIKSELAKWTQVIARAGIKMQ